MATDQSWLPWFGSWYGSWIGSWIGSAKRYVRDVQGQVSDLTNETLNTDIDEKPKSENKEKKKDE